MGPSLRVVQIFFKFILGGFYNDRDNSSGDWLDPLICNILDGTGTVQSSTGMCSEGINSCVYGDIGQHKRIWTNAKPNILFVIPTYTDIKHLKYQVDILEDFIDTNMLIWLNMQYCPLDLVFNRYTLILGHVSTKNLKYKVKHIEKHENKEKENIRGQSNFLEFIIRWANNFEAQEC